MIIIIMEIITTIIKIEIVNFGKNERQPKHVLRETKLWLYGESGRSKKKGTE